MGIRRGLQNTLLFVIKEQKNLTDEELVEFMALNPIGRVLGYKRKPNPSIFSKVRSRSDRRILRNFIIGLCKTQ